MKLKRIVNWTFRVVAVLILLVVLGLFIGYWMSNNDCGKTAAPANPIKAIVYCDYGPPDVLRLEQIEKPVPNDDQVLIKVHAASVNPYDWHFVRGTPYLMRLGVGLRKPKSTRIGADVAGTVEAEGKNVTRFKPGVEI